MNRLSNLTCFLLAITVIAMVVSEAGIQPASTHTGTQQVTR